MQGLVSMSGNDAADITPWAWVAHCPRSGGEPIFVTAEQAAELKKFDDWDVFQVGKIPSRAGHDVGVVNNQPKMPMPADNPCSQPQAHPARCGCEQVASKFVHCGNAHNLLSRVMDFDLATKQGQAVQLRQLLSEIGNYLKEQGQ